MHMHSVGHQAKVRKSSQGAQMREQECKGRMHTRCSQSRVCRLRGACGSSDACRRALPGGWSPAPAWQCLQHDTVSADGRLGCVCVGLYTGTCAGAYSKDHGGTTSLRQRCCTRVHQRSLDKGLTNSSSLVYFAFCRLLRTECVRTPFGISEADSIMASREAAEDETKRSADESECSKHVYSDRQEANKAQHLLARSGMLKCSCARDTTGMITRPRLVRKVIACLSSVSVRVTECEQHLWTLEELRRRAEPEACWLLECSASCWTWEAEGDEYRLLEVGLISDLRLIRMRSWGKSSKLVYGIDDCFMYRRWHRLLMMR